MRSEKSKQRSLPSRKAQTSTNLRGAKRGKSVESRGVDLENLKTRYESVTKAEDDTMNAEDME